MHILWATGSTIVIKSVDKPTNRYLKGHDGPVVGICCSQDGKLLATGEQQYPDVQAALIVWDFDTFEMVFRVRYHRDCVHTLSFNCDSRYLISMGSIHDNNQVVCWNMAEGRSESVSPATDQLNQECSSL